MAEGQQKYFCGMTAGTVFHFWVFVVLIDTLAKNLWFNTDYFGEAQKAPWLTLGPLLTLSAMAVALFYFSDMLLDEEDHFWKRMVYVGLNTMLFFACAGFAMDCGLYLMDKEWYCKLQKETDLRHCDERNRPLKPMTILFFLVIAPVFFRMNTILRRHAEERKAESDARLEAISLKMNLLSQPSDTLSPKAR